MTIYELVNDSTIQGNVRISTWKEDEEEVLLEIRNTDDLFTSDLEEEWEDAEVDYIFCGRDGYLHIEVKSAD